MSRVLCLNIVLSQHVRPHSVTAIRAVHIIVARSVRKLLAYLHCAGIFANFCRR